MFANIVILIFGILGIGFGILLLRVGFKSFKEKKLIKKTPTSKIKSLTHGLVEISGEVYPHKGELLQSPFTNQGCVYYKYAIEKYQWSKYSQFKWKKIDEKEERIYFYLKDETGMVLVDPKEAEMNISPTYEFSSPFGKEPPENIRLFLQLHDMDYKGFLGMNKKMRFGESRIVPGRKLFIMGHAVENPFPKDGISDKDEANFMIKKGEDTYLISDQSEKDTLKTKNWTGLSGILGGTVFILVCLLGILFILNIIKL